MPTILSAQRQGRQGATRPARKRQGFWLMGSKAWVLVMFTMLASTLPVHALIISARRRRGDFKAELARSERGESLAHGDDLN